MPDDRPAPKARFSSQELRHAEEVAQASVAHIREFILSTPGLNSHPSRNSTLEDDIRDVVDGRAGHYGARIRVEEISAAELEDPMEVIRVALRAAINAGNFEEFDVPFRLPCSVSAVSYSSAARLCHWSSSTSTSIPSLIPS